MLTVPPAALLAPPSSTLLAPIVDRDLPLLDWHVDRHQPAPLSTVLNCHINVPWRSRSHSPVQRKDQTWLQIGLIGGILLPELWAALSRGRHTSYYDSSYRLHGWLFIICCTVPGTRHRWKGYDLVPPYVFTSRSYALTSALNEDKHSFTPLCTPCIRRHTGLCPEML